MHSITTLRSAFLLLLVVLFAFSLGPVSAQGKEPAKVFKPAIDQIWGKTPIPILLPTKLPAAISEKDVKLALGDVTYDPTFEHRIAEYLWNVSLPGPRRRLIIDKDVSGNRLGRGYEFDHTVGCGGANK